MLSVLFLSQVVRVGVRSWFLLSHVFEAMAESEGAPKEELQVTETKCEPSLAPEAVTLFLDGMSKVNVIPDNFKEVCFTLAKPPWKSTVALSSTWKPWSVLTSRNSQTSCWPSSLCARM